MNKQSSPLSGIRVLDFTRAMAGPYCTMLLGDMGAEVIKVEPPEGDETRHWKPPEYNGISTYFLSVNRNKKSIALDLKKKEAIEVVYNLVNCCDVVVENFRPGVAERLGIGYNKLSSYRTDIIYCSISGYGHSGPMKDKSGYDLTVLASSGLMFLTGETDGQPVKFGVPIADINAGLFAALSILLALYERKISGSGRYIDLSMFDCALAILTHQAASYLCTGGMPVRMGSEHPSIAPYSLFRASDGYIAIAAASEKLWNELCEAVGCEELTRNPRFSTNEKRVKHRKELKLELETRFSKLTVNELCELLDKRGVPCAKVEDMRAAEGEQARQRGMLLEMSHPVYGGVRVLGTPFTRENPDTIPPPLLSEHAEQVLMMAGYSKTDVERLFNSGAVVPMR
jgi:crotonobetainyl-CoA:carnitine CoA-transferase CaiB-like acyl-CoA transferase